MTKRMLFVLAAIVLAVAGLYSLSRSAAQAKSLAATVVAQDTAGSSYAAAQTELDTYVKTHMGASVSYTLTGSYNRAVTAANAAANAQSPSGQIYAQAQAACSGKSNSIVQAQCNQAYLSTHLVNLPAPAPVVEPKLSDYHHALVAPTWTADLTGALFLGAFAALMLSLVIRPGAKR